MNIESITLAASVLAIAVIVFLAIFLAARYVILWYFRINEIVVLLEKQVALLQIIANQQSGKQDQAKTQPAPRRNPLSN